MWLLKTMFEASVHPLSKQNTLERSWHLALLLKKELCLSIGIMVRIVYVPVGRMCFSFSSVVLLLFCHDLQPLPLSLCCNTMNLLFVCPSVPEKLPPVLLVINIQTFNINVNKCKRTLQSQQAMDTQTSKDFYTKSLDVGGTSQPTGAVFRACND